MRATTSITGFLLLSWLVSGCATGSGGALGLRGLSGDVAWEVVDLRTEPTPDNPGVLWYYTLVLRETAGTAIQFERVERHWSTEPGNSALTEMPFPRRLDARSELRWSRSDGVVSRGGSAFGSAAKTIQVRFRFLGKDEKGRQVRVDIPLTLSTRAIK